jgi:hypothetical protein
LCTNGAVRHWRSPYSAPGWRKWVSQAFLQTERGRGRRHLIRISTSGSGTGSGLSGTTEGFHQLWTLHLLSLYFLSPSQPSKKRKAADLCGVTEHADQGGRAGEEEEECDDITYDDVKAYVPRGLIQLLSWLGVSGALAALDDVLCTASVRSRLSTTCELDCRGFGTGRQKMVLERGTPPKLSRRTCSPRYGLQSWRRISASVAKRPRERSPTL